ncbi:hypothetical protein FBEOM_12860 [Fusarium beomiforme]|uniref:ubiquitinyl hydrolase 1 n=1 Tax=Fusarium beomiforme TaxID=44412 RepID=A0A9P5A6Z2_9HYPO|nr:hypothetical protein FBEOM_12860 [Fusarium beomiforme]
MTETQQYLQHKTYCTGEHLEYIFKHLILPTKVPGRDDSSASNEEFLIAFVLKCLEQFARLSESDDEIISKQCLPMLENMRDARGSRGFIDSTGVKDSLKKISAEGTSSLYHITEQNAGLLIRKTGDSFCFHTFELSPTNKAAMTTKDRLIREFPATATEVSGEDFNNPSFQDVLTRTLVKMDHQAVAEMQPKVKKAQQMHDEERDTIDPRIVTELLTSFLRGAGTSVEIKAIRKHTREEVSWRDSASPWRRSPLWLLIRVGLQLTMTTHGSQDLYKNFMLFLIAQALDIAHSKNSPSEMIHLMMAKIARRLCKLRDVKDGKWLHVVEKVVASASACLKERWVNVQQRNEKSLDLDSLVKFDFQDHTRFPLPELNEFLATIPQRQNQSSAVAFNPRSIDVIFEPYQLPTVNGSVNTDNRAFELAAFESWIQTNLDSWLGNCISRETSCHILKSLLESYHLSAEGWYGTRPEGMSRMLLTLGELWVAIDKMAVHHYPLLLQYSPEVPAGIWGDLLIHSKSDMKRLHRLETYITQRTDAAKANQRPSVLSSYGFALSFPVQYFEQSNNLQAKKKGIEESAQRQRDTTLVQYRNLKAHYDGIMKRYDETECEKVLQVENGVESYIHRRNNCRRCALSAQAKKLKIEPHEWPLPADELDAQVTVFEMDVPVGFAVWRDATVYILDDILGFKLYKSSESGNHPRSSHPLATYKALMPWFESQRHRVQLLSETKPHAKTHRNQRLIEHSTEADVCLNNGLQFKYHDDSRNVFISHFIPNTEMSQRCTIKLPKRAHALERFLWMNILTQLAMPMVDFNKPETAIFLLQMMLQAGPYQSENIARHAHTRPTEVEFGHQLVNHLNQCLSRVRENWESYTSLCSFTCLATRFLALVDDYLSKQILGLITRCRRISYSWVLHLFAKIQDLDDLVQQEEFVETAVHIALICIETFNLEGAHFERELADEQQAAILLETSITINNNANFKRLREDPLYGFMLDRYEITLHRARPILVQEITSTESSCLDLAIEKRWPDFVRQAAWSLYSCHWVKALSGKLQVHLNLLTGELLVNGSPVSRLPREYESNSEYRKLFGSTTMEVMPSNILGMRFCSTKLFHGYTVHLGMLASNQREDLLFRHMEVDREQAIGTLIGLENKLVLRDSQDPSGRSVLIPEGTVNCRKGCDVEDHVDVSIDLETATRVHIYRLDPLLCRIISNGKVESKLYLAYLHALTSYCLPDPFIQRTGTEEAITILNSASIRAPTVFSEDAYATLFNIASLSPKRRFYPADKQEMQNVTWRSDLSYLSQDDRFGNIVRLILEQSREVEFLFPKHKIPVFENCAPIGLVYRAIIRTAGTRVSGFGAEDFTTKHDVKYVSRERTAQYERTVSATEMASRVYTGSSSLSSPMSGMLGSRLYELMTNKEYVQSRAVLPSSRIHYDASWLNNPSSYMSSVWCELHNSYRKSPNWFDKFELMVWMATVAYSSQCDLQAVQALLILTQSRIVVEIPLPDAISYDLSLGYVAREADLLAFASSFVLEFSNSPDSTTAGRLGETSKRLRKRRQEEYRHNSHMAVIRFANLLKQQWPVRSPSSPVDAQVKSYIRVDLAMQKVLRKWSEWQKNLDFKRYLDTVVSRMMGNTVERIPVSSEPARSLLSTTKSARGFVATSDLFTESGVLHNNSPPNLGQMVLKISRDEESTKLAGIIDDLDSKAKFDYEHRYLQELRDSLSSLQGHAESEMIPAKLANLPELLQDHLGNCQSHLANLHQSLISSLSSLNMIHDPMRSILQDAGFPSRVSPTQLLQQLRPSQWKLLSSRWKESIIHYGMAIAGLQQAKRLIRFQSSHVDLTRELENGGHKSWSPYDHPEWLLLECESEIMIWDVQQQIAKQMTDPPEHQNAVMQLNMGEGKSTVIVPIVATALGDGSKLVRVIVAKPQAKQMHQMLVSKLSGLLDRPVYLLPFSRDINMNLKTTCAIQRLMRKCMEEGGVLMVQPEHLLPFQLMELECRINGNIEVTEAMSQTRTLFGQCSRDIVDESDENFSVKFELVYTLGQQRPIEHSPDRWVVIQEVMALIPKVATEVKSQYPHSIEFGARHKGRFPRLRILRPDAEEAIFSRVTELICDTGITVFPIGRLPRRVRDAVRRYISQHEPTAADIETVEGCSLWNETTSRNVLLLRGLFAGGILSFALGSKRWRVNYGVDHNREKMTKLAVPFRAKDNPTPRSEFSHPDVVITLTCLSYYYSGLDDEALFSAFDLLGRADNAMVEYQEWVKTAPLLPASFKTLEGVNLRDRVLCTTKIFPSLRYSKAAIDYYLCHLVFAKESKEFPHKLSASGWDLGKKKDNLTTGFSGTNDSRYVLPLDVKQLDLPEQKHTNALVLEYLLQPETGISLMPPKTKGMTFDSQILLQMVSKMSKNTRVILDVGAQVVDLTNQEFARQWLALHQNDDHTQAAIFVNDSDEIVIIDHSGKVEDFQTSPFSNQSDRCLVFLDEAHTRGTDLKFPADYRAVVTLGAGLTKDRLVQACMRMRKLGKGQTVEFCIPWEIEQKIMQFKHQDDPNSHDISVSDVLCWAIAETCLDLRRAMPLWLTQGVRFNKQQALWSHLSDNCALPDGSSATEAFLEEEGQSLSERYCPQRGVTRFSSMMDELSGFIANDFKSRCEEFGLKRLQTCSLHEEQERELSPETQHERQVERPPPLKPETHTFNRALKEWITNGSFQENSDGFRFVMKPAFQSLRKTSAAAHFDVTEFPETVWVTMDFSHTVKGEFGAKNYSDSYQRPVQWVLTGKNQKGASRIVVISPFEAQHYLPQIEASEHVTLHIYAPRVNLSFQPLDNLQLYLVGKKPMEEIPRDIVAFLNLFAGQLYASSYKDYKLVCDLLGLAWHAAEDGDDGMVGFDGFSGDGHVMMVNVSGPGSYKITEEQDGSVKKNSHLQGHPNRSHPNGYINYFPINLQAVMEFKTYLQDLTVLLSRKVLVFLD